MVDTQRLNDRIDRSGLKKYYIASKIGLTTYGLQKKITNQTQFKANEIEWLCIVLQIETLEEKEKIFFSKSVAKMETEKCIQKKSKHDNFDECVFTQNGTY